MMIKVPDNSKNRPTLVAGTYVATLQRIESHPTEEETAQGIVPQYGPYLTFVFKIQEPEQFANAYWSGICSPSSFGGSKKYPKPSKLISWLRGFGGDPEQYFTDSQLDESLLVGKQVRLTLTPNPKNQKLQIASINPLDGSPVQQSSASQISVKPAVKPAVSVQSAPKVPVVQTQQPDDEVPF